MVRWLVPLAAMALCAAAEWLHGGRCRRMAYLAFGPEGRPRRWVAIAPVARVAAVGAVCWGLIVLVQIDAALWDGSEQAQRDGRPIHHIVIALDVSPSMQIEDAGPQEAQTRAERARDVLRSVLDRIDLPRTRTSIVAFYTEARPVVIDTSDREVVANILDDLPLEHAFEAGKTDMYTAVAAAAEFGRIWTPQSASLVLVSDGDTLPSKEIPVLPAAFGSSLILGVGNPYRGKFIDGHSSRQDASSLRRLALRLGGLYHDANTRHVATAELQKLNAWLPLADRGSVELRDLAIWAVLAGAFVTATVPLALALFGATPNSARRPVPAAPLQSIEIPSRGQP